MSDIPCGLCMDLIPLVRDGIASEESRQAVERHIQSCAACAALYGGEAPPAANAERAFRRFRQQTRTFAILLMAFGIFFGVGLTTGANMFYNSLIMPIVGVFGYLVFRWRALYRVPALLLAAHGLLNGFRTIWEKDGLDLLSLLVWTGVYIVFAVAGTLAAGLLHYAFRKEK